MVTWDNTVLQETLGEVIAESNMSFQQETQLDLLLFSGTLFSRRSVLTFVLGCFSCSFILVFNIYDFSVAPLVRVACVTLVRFISIEKKQNKVSYNSSVGEEPSLLKRQKKKQTVCC